MQTFKKTLEENNYKVLIASNKQEALELSKEFIKKDMVIGLGGSTSVKDIGLLDYLVNKNDITLHNQYELGITMQENINRRRKGMLSDLYVTSTNAITKNGYLINADGSGNRVASMIFGPKNVLLIVGKNKIVDTIEDGQKRLLEVAAVKNIDRMNNIAIAANKEPRHNIDNIATKYTQIKTDEKDRIIIILVDEDLGY
jgi:L-lactate utilization protein LutB